MKYLFEVWTTQRGYGNYSKAMIVDRTAPPDQQPCVVKSVEFFCLPFKPNEDEKVRAQRSSIDIEALRLLCDRMNEVHNTRTLGDDRPDYRHLGDAAWIAE